ncbi:hypothetical protein DPEC_G00110490 [Dallia pectoralis]|uniref:Uncharacterized protein n=1 Tax=Dallia pectoralis TaxID=75939 RepID=A0ACC2GT24_DALPE|nr:hypothetical protein DPEC_G00110490 [Dallia pectoralis]
MPHPPVNGTGPFPPAWYSTLDLANGYWQVEVDPKDQEKTAFTTPIGLFQFNRMPCGLCNAPATFQRLMQQCLGGHLHHLRQVFKKLHQQALKLQPLKCCLFRKEVLYLGHRVSQQGVATDPSKTQVVEGWPLQCTDGCKSGSGWRSSWASLVGKSWSMTPDSRHSSVWSLQHTEWGSGRSTTRQLDMPTRPKCWDSCGAGSSGLVWGKTWRTGWINALNVHGDQ